MLHFALVPLALVAALALIYFSGAVVYVPNSKIGLVQKLWSASGSLSSGLISLGDEAGYKPEVLRGGFHFFTPFQYRVLLQPIVTIAQGKIGYVFARDGAPLPTGQTLASNAEVSNFEDARGFLTGGGQKGPQRKILREGSYAINPVQFSVITDQCLYAALLGSAESADFKNTGQLLSTRGGFDSLVIRDSDDKIGVVTVHDGRTLPAGELIAPVTDGESHNSFQDPEAFLRAGGFRGRQLQVLAEGTYYLNRLFATVEMVPKTIIEVGTVGVVVSYTGPTAQDTSGEAYRHGELVPRGARGVWNEPLLPGKYAFNPYAGKVTVVPTTNFILKWEQAAVGSHRFDENLKEVALITKDAFEAFLPLSVVVHIDYTKAPLVVQRFGDVKQLVEQTLDPLVAAYFKNQGQTKTLVELLQERSDIQDRSSVEMRTKFSAYNLELQEVLIGTPKSDPSSPSSDIENILAQLRMRQVAVEQVATYKMQETAAAQERSLREAEAKASQQADITRSSISIEVQANEGRAVLARAQQEAETTVVMAKARAEQLRLDGEGKASAIRQVGEAEAAATALKVEAFGGPQYQLTSQVMTRFAEAVENGKIALVPQVQVSSAGEDGQMPGGGVMGALLTMMLADKAKQAPAVLPAPSDQ